MTASTPIYRLKYLVPGEPARNTRQALEDNAFTIEAALAGGGVAPPGAADHLALVARLNALEADQAAEDALGAPQAVTWSSGFGQFSTSPYGEAVRAYKTAPDRVRLDGLVQSLNALTAGSTAVTMFTLPVGYRPAVTLLRTGWYAPGSTGSTAPVPYRLHLTSAGLVAVIVHAATPAGSWFQLQDVHFRTVNT